MEYRFDKITKIFNASMGILVTKYPTRTSIGFLLGIALMVFFDTLKGFYALPLPVSLGTWPSILIGVLIAHIRTLFTIFLNKDEFDEDIENAFKAIERAGKKGMPTYQRNIAYKRLCEVILENLESKIQG